MSAFKVPILKVGEVLIVPAGQVRTGQKREEDNGCARALAQMLEGRTVDLAAAAGVGTGDRHQRRGGTNQAGC